MAIYNQEKQSCLKSLFHERSLDIQTIVSMPIGAKICLDICLRHYLFRETSSFLRAWLPQGKLSLQEQKMSKDKNILALLFMPNTGNCVYYP